MSIKNYGEAASWLVVGFVLSWSQMTEQGMREVMVVGLEAVCESKVELLEEPQNVHEARVIVTFLPGTMGPEGGPLFTPEEINLWI